MYSGRSIGWNGQIEWPPPPIQQPGKHRRTRGSGKWTPRPRPDRAAEGGADGGVHAAGTDEAVGADPMADTVPTGGLHKFDLGMVPASVTPPRSWRRAAWFAVASSAAALGGLVFATSTLVSNSSTVDGMSLPGMPRGADYPGLRGQDRYFLTGTPFRTTTSHASPVSHPVTARRLGVVPAASGTSTAPEPPSNAAPATTAYPTATFPAAPPQSRPPTSEPLRLLEFSDAEAVKSDSQRYFAAIRDGDLRGAYALTTGELRAEGFEAFAARYPNVATLEVVAVEVTPIGTINTLRLTGHDGAVSTQRRELRFTLGSDPLINADERVD